LSIGSLMTTGLDGMKRGLAGASSAASDIAATSTFDFGDETNLPQQISGKDATVNLAESMVNLDVNQRLFDASAKVVKVADQLLGTLLDTKV